MESDLKHRSPTLIRGAHILLGYQTTPRKRIRLCYLRGTLGRLGVTDLAERTGEFPPARQDQAEGPAGPRVTQTTYPQAVSPGEEDRSGRHLPSLVQRPGGLAVTPRRRTRCPGDFGGPLRSKKQGVPRKEKSRAEAPQRTTPGRAAGRDIHAAHSAIREQAAWRRGPGEIPPMCLDHAEGPAGP
ncbi:hypothetical protein NDU88_001502 [Pleurodeles waltl]|uniref:Uncharacterized protein n=1 Tax=Pleurodeles waltl TaxID=8319 RepID=A0AAV7NJ85_PLEWA|nr:hypothetical protein NDU88_001502 [Pleurodeles waltl]